MKTILAILLFLSIPAYGQVAPFVFVPSAGASPPVLVQVTDTSEASGGTTCTETITIGSGENRCLVVFAPFNEASGTPLVDSVKTSNGTHLTIVDSLFRDGYPEEGMFVWALVNPPTGTQSVTAYYNKSMGRVILILAEFTGVNQGGGSSTFGNRAEACLLQTSMQVTVTGTSNDVIVGLFKIHGLVNGTGSQWVAGSGTTLQDSIVAVSSSTMWAGLTTEAGGTSVAIGGTIVDNKRWSGIGFALKP